MCSTHSRLSPVPPQTVFDPLRGGPPEAKFNQTYGQACPVARRHGRFIKSVQQCQKSEYFKQPSNIKGLNSRGAPSNLSVRFRQAARASEADGKPTRDRSLSIHKQLAILMGQFLFILTVSLTEQKEKITTSMKMPLNQSIMSGSTSDVKLSPSENL